MPIKRRRGVFGGPTAVARRRIVRRARSRLTRRMVYASLGRRIGYAGARYYPYAAGAYGAYRAVKYIRARRSRFGRSNVGEAVGTGTSKVRVYQNTSTENLSTRTLYSDELTNIPAGDERNERERNLVNLRGFKICATVYTRGSVPLYVNLAVLAPKVNQNPPATENFFRNPGQQRGQNFSNALTAMEFHCLAINTDKYTVLRHKRYRLGQAATSTQFETHGGNPSYMNINWWIPMKRQLRYEDRTNDSPVDGICFFTYWFDRLNANGGSSPFAEVSMQRYITSYFRDPKP